MRTLAYYLVIIFFFCMVGLRSENAPITTVGVVTNATTAPGGVTVPVTVKNFVSIGSFTLTLRYQASQVTYVSAAFNSAFSSMTVTNTVSGTLGKLVITWPQTAGGLTLPDETHLLDLTFTYISGNSIINWLYSGSNICQYKKYSNGSYILLNDTPKPFYYINGGISNHGAPITYAPTFLNPAPGELNVPITVDNFTSVGAMSLTLEYNQSVLSFISCTKNTTIGGTFNAGVSVGPNGKMLLTVSWYGNATLANGSTVFTIKYTYSTTNGSCSGLDWYETGSSCEYADQYSNPFFDAPTADYYHSGLVYTQYSPRVWLPTMTNATPSASAPLPVLVNNFSNVRSFTLSFDYDPAVMTYGSFTPDAAFGSVLTATDSPSGSKRKIVLSWTGTANKTLPDGSPLGTINFTYISGTTTLAWIVTDATSCRFNDAIGNVFYDAPKSTYYQDGLVASHTAPQTAAGNVTASTGQPVTVPLKVFNYSNLGLFSLTLDYDPSVLTYQSSALVPAIGGTFTAATAGLGRIVLNWSGTAASLADNSTLANLIFTYNGGASPLTFFDDGNSSRFAESAAGTSLYDLPRSFYYVNGYVGPNPLAADFIAGNVFDDYAANVVLTDLTTGGPAAWSWTISPSSYFFQNGTTSTSQNPQIHFTSNGVYTITLIVTRGMGAAIKVRTDYLYIGTPGLWTGITSTDWNTGSNWHNYQVPSSTASITIPASAPHWPHVTGNLTVGTFCQNIVMEGSSEFSVDGNLTINPGSSLSFTGSGTLFLGGDWLNSGTFIAGASTIDFTGPNDAFINGGIIPESFHKVIFSKTNATVTIQGNINITGP